jgi:hypothetical protein
MGGTLRCVGGRSCSYTYRGRPVTYWRQSTAAAKLSQSPKSMAGLWAGRRDVRSILDILGSRTVTIVQRRQCTLDILGSRTLPIPNPSHSADNLLLIPSQFKSSFPTHNTFPTSPHPSQTPDYPQTCPAYTSHTYPHHKTPTAAHDHSQQPLHTLPQHAYTAISRHTS